MHTFKNKPNNIGPNTMLSINNTKLSINIGPINKIPKLLHLNITLLFQAFLLNHGFHKLMHTIITHFPNIEGPFLNITINQLFNITLLDDNTTPILNISKNITPIIQLFLNFAILQLVFITLFAFLLIFIVLIQQQIQLMPNGISFIIAVS